EVVGMPIAKEPGDPVVQVPEILVDANINPVELTAGRILKNGFQRLHIVNRSVQPLKPRVGKARHTDEECMACHGGPLRLAGRRPAVVESTLLTLAAKSFSDRTSG